MSRIVLDSVTKQYPDGTTAVRSLNLERGVAVMGIQYKVDTVAKAAETHTPVPGNHSPEFAPVPEPTIRTGVLTMSMAVLNLMGK